jgi:hypothetical protein
LRSLRPFSPFTRFPPVKQRVFPVPGSDLIRASAFGLRTSPYPLIQQSIYPLSHRPTHLSSIVPRSRDEGGSRLRQVLS